MNTLETPFRIVTPMFLGGADQAASDIRPSSIKGALRFWWRALNWGQCLKKSPNEEMALRLLHSEEVRLFGAAANDQGGGQGVFLMSVAQEKTPTVDQPFRPLMPGQLYLRGMMGLGTFKEGGKCLRNALEKGGTFTLKLIFHPKASPEDVQQVKDAIKAFELLGALGSRARHGLGSLASAKLMTLAEYEKALKDLLQNRLFAGALPPFTAFSAKTRMDISDVAGDPLKLLDAVGREQQLYRSFGQQGKVNGQEAERNFKPDHDMILAATNGATLQTAPKRTVFGLPNNYFFSSTKGKADVNYAPNNQESRRSSPLLLHIHPLSDGSFVAVHTLMPAKFLPTGGNIQIKSGRNVSNVPASPDWQVLHTYLDRFEEKKGVIHGSR
jgi:CRISPR-associated protein Cmr1